MIKIIMLILLAFSMFLLIESKKELDRVIEFTGYKHIEGVIEHCNGRTVVNDSIMWCDREVRDSIYDLILR